jgi:hypothetical protein
MASKRETLIVQLFEAWRDVTWFEKLEPKFRLHGVEGRELEDYRDAWNEHAEIRDLPWFQHKEARTPIARLEDAVMDMNDRLEHIGLLRWRDEQNRNKDFQQQITEAASRIVAKDNEKERER